MAYKINLLTLKAMTYTFRNSNYKTYSKNESITVENSFELLGYIKENHILNASL